MWPDNMINTAISILHLPVNVPICSDIFLPVNIQLSSFILNTQNLQLSDVNLNTPSIKSITVYWGVFNNTVISQNDKFLGTVLFE